MKNITFKQLLILFLIFFFLFGDFFNLKKKLNKMYKILSGLFYNNRKNGT